MNVFKKIYFLSNLNGILSLVRNRVCEMSLKPFTGSLKFYTIPLSLLFVIKFTSCSACFSSSVSEFVSSWMGSFFWAFWVVGAAGVRARGLERVGPLAAGPEVGLFDSIRASKSVPRSSRPLVFPDSGTLWMNISFFTPVVKRDKIKIYFKL